jgi:hypothetical protein
VALSTEGAVDLGALTLEECIRGARLLVQLGELADGRGHEKLGGVIADLALAFTAAARAKVPVGGLPPAAA